MPERAAKVLVYCQDSFGLGHLRRNVNICHELNRLQPETRILIIADSPLAPFFELPVNSDFVKLPTIIKVNTGVWKVHRLPLVTMKDIWKIRSQMIKEIALSFRPDVMLVDHMPHGAKGELVECLQSLRSESFDTQVVLGLRDILGAPDVIIQQWRSEGAYQTISRFYDKVFVYGTEDLYNLASSYDFPDDIRKKVHYCGYVCKDVDTSQIPPDKVNSQFSTVKPFTVLVMGGGGSDAFYFMNTMLDAIRYLGQEVPFNTFILTGPFMAYKKRQALWDKADGLPVIVKRMGDDSVKYLHDVDLVVSMAGYNTICEILQFAKKAVVVPRAGPSAEQSMRSQLLHDRRLLVSIHPRELTAQALAEAISKQLYSPNGISLDGVPDLEGARRAASLLLGDAGEMRNEKVQHSPL